MIKNRFPINFFIKLSIGFIFIVNVGWLYGQQGNSVTGYVFAAERRPVYDINVELMDDFSRTLARTKTNASGRFSFSGFPSGRYRVRILPTGLDFEEQEQEFEIQNFLRSTPNGGTVNTGFENVQKDFYLKKRKTAEPKGPPESVFVQDVPLQAKEKYNNALKLLEGKQVPEGLKELKSSIEIFQNYYDAIERLGTEYVKLQHYEAARILLYRATEINPRSYQSWYGLSYAFYSLQKAEEGLKTVNKALDLKPNSVESLLLSGAILRKLKQFGEAEKQLKKAKTLSTVPIPEIHWQLALLYAHNLNRYHQAAEELEIYLKVKPDSPETENIKKLIKQFREKAKNKT